MSEKSLQIYGASLHNLQRIDVTIPRDKLTVITGVSGSGKSTLAFDTIYAEGQRRYVESLSAYVRQFLGLMQKPPVDKIKGLSPAISIQQKGTSHNPRSTVGTITEIHDYFRVLFARAGSVHCPDCSKPIEVKTTDEVCEEVMSHFTEGEKIIVLAPVVSQRKGTFDKLFEQMRSDGYTRARIDGKFYRLEDRPELKKNFKHNIEIVIDRLVLKEKVRSRVREAVELAMEIGEGTVLIHFPEKKSASDTSDRRWSRSFSCLDCQTSIPELSPRLFSFNSPMGACPRCEGLGYTFQFDPELIADKKLSIEEGAILAPGIRYSGYYAKVYDALAEKFSFSVKTPINQLSQEQRDMIFQGTGDTKVDIRFVGEHSLYSSTKPFSGVINVLKRRYLESSSETMKIKYTDFMRKATCESCQGARLAPGPLNIFLKGENIHSVSEFTISECFHFFNRLTLSGEKAIIAKSLLKEVKSRLTFLMDVGLDYLSLNRRSNTLSGGEMQRIRLATQIGSGLVGVLYILDEPSIGLHSRDNNRLIRSLLKLRDLGNTILVVEHDEEIMCRADHLIDMGPGAGIHGGKVIYSGSYENILRSRQSVTGKFLTGKEKIEIPTSRRIGQNHLHFRGLSANNLANIQVDIPLGCFICVTGVSGSGKSSMVNDTIWPLLSRELNRSKHLAGPCISYNGFEHLDKAIVIDQSPIGRTPRSNPATYTKVFDEIRKLYSLTPEAKIRGYRPGRFSFNVTGGRCENCQGDGVKKIEMHLLPDVFVQCEVCKGKRFNQETLKITFKGFSISEVLQMTVEQAFDIFQNIPKIRVKLETLVRVGLGYIKLGQSALGLSGGEAQRVKLATELSKRSTGKTIYILDEPTTGLHFSDIRLLLKVLHDLVDKGNTVLVVEHNMDVIKTADHIIDLGPDGGPGGGNLVFSGTPEDIIHCKESCTGMFLKPIIKQRVRKSGRQQAIRRGRNG